MLQSKPGASGSDSTKTAALPAAAVTPPTTTGRFAVAHTWPEMRNAEYEVLQRMSIAAKNIGVTMIAVDNDGRPLWSNAKISLDKAKPIEPDQIDFLLSMHFESPKLIDTYSYYAAWQPLQFYHQFGYAKSIEKVLTHNEWLSCDSKMADAHARNVFQSARPLRPGLPPQMFHSPPGPYLPPKIGPKSRPFYVGINWERINGTKGRHHDLLQMLDRDELIDIYGPQTFLGVQPWRDFKTYRGELPFDGRSVVRAQNESGICLALSSTAHKISGLMSNRLFEGLAAGAAIICDSNAFAQEHFSDVVYFVNDRASDEELYFQIKAIVEEIRNDPKAATERALKGQKRLAERFSLEDALKGLMKGHADRQATYRKLTLAQASCTVIVVYTGEALPPLLDLLDMAVKQTGISVEIALICDTAFYAMHSAAIKAKVASAKKFTPQTADFSRFESSQDETPEPSPTGKSVAAVLGRLTTDYFAFLQDDECWFKDHLGSIIGAIERTPGATMGASGVLIEDYSKPMRPTRSLGELGITVPEHSLLHGDYDADKGRFVFAKSVAAAVPGQCIQLLDGQEPNLVRLTAALAGKLAPSNLATYVRKEHSGSTQPVSVLPVVEQQQYIRDAFTGHVDYRARLSVMTAARGVPPQTGPQVRWENSRYPRALAKRLPIDINLDTSAGAPGVKYLGDGFSTPEATHTWIEGKSGIIEFSCRPDEFTESTDHDFALLAAGRPSVESGRNQHCTILINGQAVSYVEIPQERNWIRVRMPLMSETQARMIRIEIVPDHTDLVYDAAGQVTDPRQLSVCVYAFALLSAGMPRLKMLSKDATYSLSRDGNGLSLLASGFSTPEPHGIWVVGSNAVLRFQLPTPVTASWLRIYLSGRSSAAGHLQKMKADLNGEPVGEFTLPERSSHIYVPLKPEIVGKEGVCRLSLEFAHCAPVRNEGGMIVDNRQLAACLLEISLKDRVTAGPKRPLPPLSKWPGRAVRRLRRMLGSGS